MTDLTPEQVRAFHKSLEEINQCSFVPKKSSRGMQVAGEALELLGIQTAEQFEGFTTTIGTEIFTAYEIGVPSDDYPLEWQVKTAIHETVHVGQFFRGGWIWFGMAYLVNKIELVRFEAEAYASEYDVEYWRTGRAPRLEQSMDSLRLYGCNEAQIANAKVRSAQIGASVSLGLASSPRARIGVEVLERIAPNWKLNV